jgi:Pentapeptide repeats (8 copies)
MADDEPMPADRPVARPAVRPRAQAALLAAGVAAFLVLIVASVIWLPRVIVELDRDPGAPGPLTQAEGVAARNGVRVILLQGVGGLALLLGAATGAWATLRQIRVSQEGQITERFTRAVEQLGSAEVDVRIGGLYGLQRIAEDAEVERGPITEVLSAYVRNRAPWPPQRLDPASDPERDGPDRDGFDVPHLRVRSPDVQAAMAVLGGSADWRPRSAVLQIGAVDLRRAYLIRSDLEGTYLHGAQLDGAWLRGSHMARVNLHEASVRRAHLRDVDLSHADLRQADLRGSDLRGADLRRARLLGADLRGVRLAGARLDGAVTDAATRWPDGFEPAVAANHV